MDELNQHLTNRFSALRDGRSGPVFFLEHGLLTDEREELFDQVRAACREHPIDDVWWRARPLPLLVMATEIGYHYQGCGTDFWPLLGEELCSKITDAERQTLKEMFQQAAHEFRGAVPKPTPWTEAFHLIAWPIVHAIVPIEFHRRLATLLADLRVAVADLDDDRLYRSICLVPGTRSGRFASFLEDAQIVVAVARHLLVGTGGSLTDETLARIAADLSDDGTAKRDLLAARGIQRSLRKKPIAGVSRQLVPVEGRLRLRNHGSDLILEAGFPSADPALVERLRLAVRKLRYAPRLWNVSARIPAEQLLSTVPFILRLSEVPNADTPLLPDLDGLDLDADLRDELLRYSLDLEVPVVFSISEDPEGRIAQQATSQELSASRNYWILIADSAQGEFNQLKRVGSIGPFVCKEADPTTREGKGALETIGHRLIAGASVGFAGAAPINGEAPVPEFVAGDVRVLVQRRSHAQGLSVRLGDEEVSLAGESLRITVPHGEHVLQVSTESQTRRYRFKGVESSSPSIAGLITLRLTSSEGTIQALQSGAIGLRIESLAPFDGLDLFLELIVMGHRFSAYTALGPLPRVVQSDEQIWNELLDERARRLLARADRCELRVRIGALASTSWELEQRVRPYWWEFGPAGPSLKCENGRVPHAAISAGDPTGISEDPEWPDDEVRLLVPVPEPSEILAANEFVTLCVGSPQFLAMDPIPAQALARQRSSRDGRLGFENLVSSYLKWSLADTDNVRAELRRRQVARILDNRVAGVCCGTEWAAREQALGEHSPWQMLLDRCIEAGLGLDPYVELLPGESTDICYEGIAEARRLLPELMVRADSFGDDDRISLNAAFGRAYETLAERNERKGRRDKAARLRGGDPSTPVNDWREALVDVRARTALHSIASLLLPTIEAPRLVGLNASLLPLDELSVELKNWTSRSRAALAGPIPQDDVLTCILCLWVAPARAVEMDWRSALDTLLTERCIARSARYLSLRARQGS